jgi:hypothetical protein
MADRFEIEVSFEDESSDEVMDTLTKAGAKDIKPPGLSFGGAEIILAVLVLEALANLITKLAPLWKCGVVVDARERKIAIQKDCKLPAGSVLYIGLDGTKTTLHRPSEIELDALIKELKSS